MSLLIVLAFISASMDGYPPNACVYRAAERPHQHPLEPRFGGSGATPCWATLASIIIAALSCHSPLFKATTCALPSASFPSAASGFAPFPPRCSLAISLALARALRLRLRDGRPGKIRACSERMRSTAGKRAETVPSLARAIAGVWLAFAFGDRGWIE